MIMNKIRLNRNWRFHLGEVENGGYKGLCEDGWAEVTLPHDWSVEHPFDQGNSSGTGYLPGGVGWYRRRVSLPDDIGEKTVRVWFGGAYQNSRVYINSNYLGMRPYGYSSFSYDISDFATPGENVIAVRVEHMELADSRWFTGNGLYRDVSLFVGEKRGFAECGVFITTAGADANRAELSIRWALRGSTADVRFTALDAAGQKCGAAEAHGENGEVEMILSAPRLWSPDSPALYTLKCEHESGDTEEIPFGIRTFSFDPDEGFFLNGVNTKLKGVCVHHDAGALGAAVPKRVWARRLRKLKEAGTNAIRFSHNPPDPHLLDLCDEMGLLAIDEAFDEWEGCKNKWWQGHNVYPPKRFGYSDAFPTWHEADLAAMVLRDRNHPSIILWSTGNEVDYPNDPYVHPLFESMTGNNDANKPPAERVYDPNRPNAERLVTVSARLREIVRQHDGTRPVTVALAFPELSNLTGLAGTVDVVGYNYKEHLYEDDHAKYPNHVIFGSENGKRAAEWLYVKHNSYICGQFLWTGIDFLGEARGWPVRVSQAGILNTAGFEKPGFALRRALWTDAPCAALATSLDEHSWDPAFVWDYQPGETVHVRCYANCEPAELFLNGRSLGVRAIDEQCEARWAVVYEPGELRVCCGATEDTLRTPSEPREIRLNADRGELSADGEDILQVEVSLHDAQETLAASRDLTIAYALIGDAQIIGIENGDPQDLTPYPSRERRTYRGQAIVYVRAGDAGGEAKLIARAENGALAEAEVAIIKR